MAEFVEHLQEPVINRTVLAATITATAVAAAWAMSGGCR
jgi:hypothetical protein